MLNVRCDYDRECNEDADYLFNICQDNTCVPGYIPNSPCKTSAECGKIKWGIRTIDIVLQNKQLSISYLFAVIPSYNVVADCC